MKTMVMTSPRESTADTTSGTTAAANSGIHGRIVMAPGCAVEQQGSPCPELGVPAHIEVRMSGSSDVVARVDSAADGRFSVDLPVGDYDVTATVDQGVPMPQTTHKSTTVMPDGYTSLLVTFESGIRGPVSR